MIRPAALAVVAVVSALLGGTSALLLGKAFGWVDDDRTETVVFAEADGAAPPVAPSPTPARETTAPGQVDGFDAAELYAARAGGVVTIYALWGDHATTGQGGAAQGSGFVVSKSGYVLTSSHVVTTAGEGLPADEPEAARTVYVQFRDADRVEAEIVGWDVFDDIAVLKIDPAEHELRPVPLGDSNQVLVGEPVAAIGAPFGNQTSLAVGVVSAVGRSIASLTSCYEVADAIQIDAPINRGNSGGPLFDASGKVIGINAQINSSTGNAEGVGFAVPINAARRSMEQLIESGRVRYAWMGISTQTLTPSLARRFDYPVARGAVVQDVVAESPAGRAGLRGGSREVEHEGVTFLTGGDVIVAVDGAAVDSAEDVVRAISQRLVPGQTAQLTYFRGSQRRTAPVTLGARPTIPPGSDC